MKILIIDDDQKKISKLVAVFVGARVNRDDIEIARSASAARRELKRIKFELVILDLLLPGRDEDQPTLEGAVHLLHELSEGDELLKPDHIIGFTAYEEAADQARPDFQRALWTIVPFDETSNSWEAQFASVVAYIQKRLAANISPDYDVDLCVVTALARPELAAVHSLHWSWQAAEPIDDSTFIRRGAFQSDGKTFSVVSACAPRMGNVAAALLTAKLIQRCRPRFLVMGGICAGIKSKANLGDAVLYSPAWEWASGKVVATEDEGSYLEPAPHQIPVSEFIASRAAELAKDKKYWISLAESHPSAPADMIPKLIVAPGASGPSVIANKDTAESIKAQHRKLSAIDMEAYGVVAAAHYASFPRPTTFVVKSVCDFADEEKKDDFQTYAAYVSAKVLETYFERFMAQIHHLAGT